MCIGRSVKIKVVPDISMQKSFLSTDNQFQRFLQVLAFVFLGYGFYLWHKEQEGSGFAILGACYSWLFSYYFSKDFLDRYKPQSVIKRVGDLLIFRQFKGVMKVSSSIEEEIELSRISTLTVGDNYISVILDGNGKGFDFVLKAKRADILAHIESILTEQEKADITIKKI